MIDKIINMKEIIILIIILITCFAIMIYLLKKDYITNKDSKKIITNSKKSKAAMLLSFGSIGTMTSLSERIYDYGNITICNTATDSIFLYILIPITTSIICLSIFYLSYISCIHNK